MTWNTPSGHRTLEGEERRVFDIAIREMAVELLHEGIDDSLSVGIPVFDCMTGCQQLVMLDFVRTYLFEETPSSNPLTAVVEGTAAAIVFYIEGQIDVELDIDRDVSSEPSVRPVRVWRKRLLRLCREREWEINPRLGKDEWQLAIDMLHDRILHDMDYLDDLSDRPPDVSQSIKKEMGIPQDYYLSVPIVEPDGPGMVEVIRRLLR